MLDHGRELVGHKLLFFYGSHAALRFSYRLDSLDKLVWDLGGSCFLVKLWLFFVKRWLMEELQAVLGIWVQF